LIKIFNSDELELFINGTPFIDLDDWRTNTIFTGYKANDTVKLNFYKLRLLKIFGKLWEI